MTLSDHADPGVPAGGRDADLSMVGAVLADRSRCKVLLAPRTGVPCPAACWPARRASAPPPHAIRLARCCYNHIACRLGVAITAALINQGCLTGHDGSIDLDRLDRGRLAGGLRDGIIYQLIDTGRGILDRLGGTVVPSPAGPVWRSSWRTRGQDGWSGNPVRGSGTAALRAPAR
jgi:hypothetical protein